MADRVGVITGGGLILVEEKHALIKKWGRKTLTLNLAEPLETVPGEFADWKLELAGDGHELVYEFDSQAEATRSEEHTSELQSLMRISYAVFCLKKKQKVYKEQQTKHIHYDKTPCPLHEDKYSRSRW